MTSGTQQDSIAGGFDGELRAWTPGAGIANGLWKDNLAFVESRVVSIW